MFQNSITFLILALSASNLFAQEALPGISSDIVRIKAKSLQEIENIDHYIDSTAFPSKHIVMSNFENCESDCIIAIIDEDVISDAKPKYSYISSKKQIKSGEKELIDNDSSMYIPFSEYTIAGTKRYTIDNSQPRQTTKIKPWATVAVGCAYFGVLTGLHIYQSQTLWNEKTNFRIIEDIDQDFFADKFGHFFGGYFTGYCSTEILIGAGFNLEMATIIGGSMGFAYQTYVEIMDGFGKNWGFSPSDFIADGAGFIYYLAQYYMPYLQNFTPKMTYFPAQWYNEKPRKESSMFIDDYSSWTFWMSAKMCNLTPASWKWPRWLDLAAGYAVRDLHFDGAYHGSPRFVIGLDYNIVELLPDGGNFLNWLKQSFNYFKFPAPAIEFGKETRFRLFYPFVFSFGTSFMF